MMGMHLMRMIGDLGQYHQPIPDFLVFLGWHNLPRFWRPFASFPFALLMVFLLPGVLATLFGYLAFRSRVRGVYFSILSQALTYAACLLFFRNSLLMGGNNGFTDFKFLLGHDLRSPATQRGLYIASALVLSLVFLGCRWLSQTRFGVVQQAIREMAPDKSLEAVVWVAVGGRGTLIGPVLGAIGVNALKSWTTRAFPDMWLLILGTLFVLVTVFMPKGIVGVPGQLLDLRRRFRPKPGPASVPQSEPRQQLAKIK